jgi:formylmethanofuran dehydrogenase subunit C
MPLVLTLRDDGRSALAVDLAGIVPDRLAALAPAEIARLPIRADGRPVELGAVFDLAGDPGDATIECRGDFSRVHRVAAGMIAGTIRVTGPVGRHAAESMRGGRLDVAGAAGDWLAAEMSGGEVHVAGNAGDNVAGALAGSPTGMRGGLVVVGGDAGSLVGARLRRGIVAIAGDCGAAPGFEMRAGTVVIGGRVGGCPGLGMRRGSIVCLTETPTLPATFLPGATWTPAFLPLLLRRLDRAGYRPATAPLPTTWRQWHGDLLTGSRGELLAPVETQGST